jgi:REP element-mobilizing transposase RayT
MPRTARLDTPGLLQHVIARGIERKDIFADDTDRQRFCSRLSTLLEATQTDCLAWALIPNHFHLLVRPNRERLGTVMNRLLTGYAVTFNRRHNRVGRLFQNRYKSIVCEEEPYLLELVRYIHLNPVRAGIVTDTDALDRYPWSGHAVLMGHTKLAGQAVDDVLGRFGRRTREARTRYSEFIAAGDHQGRREELVGGGLRRSLAFLGKTEQRESFDARVLGSGEFVEELWQKEDLRDRLPPNLTLPELAGRVAEALAVPTAQVLRRTHGTQATTARQVVCYVATRILGARGTVVGEYLGMGQSGVSRCARLGEEVWARDRGLRDFVLGKRGP